MKEVEIIEEEGKKISDENDKEENKIDDLFISPLEEELDNEENIEKSNEEQKQIENDSIKQNMLDEKQHLTDIFDDLKDNIYQNEEESLEENKKRYKWIFNMFHVLFYSSTFINI